jgi:ABC-type transporter Mla maintaining outer membrane lipid asymmetry ATPase subunit MlaF
MLITGSAQARALAENPEVVLYDEPTTMVDPLMAHRLGELIARLKVQLKLTLSSLPTILSLRKDSPIMFSSWTIVRFFSTAPWGEMERSSEALVQEFLKDDQQEFIFPKKKKKKWPLEKNSKQEKWRSRVRNGEVIE